jgi:hypothetical protein
MVKINFSELVEQLRQASDQRDWEQLAVVDAKIKAVLSQAISAAKSETDRVKLSEYLSRFQRVYRLILKDSVKYRDEISTELKKVTKDNKAANLYLDSSRYMS